MSDCTLRWADASDLPGITEIYNHYVLETFVTFDVVPHTPAGREAWLAEFAEAGRHQLFVAERAGEVQGYAYSHTFRARPAYDRTVETSVYLHPKAMGAGLGTQLYARLFEALAATDVHLAVAGVTLPNDASVALHQRFGFEAVGVFREVGHKFGRAWDVGWWQKPMGAAPAAV